MKDVISIMCESLSHVQLFATPWTVACQALLSMRFSRKEYWSGLPFPSLGHLPEPGIEPGSPALQADAFLSEPPGKPQNIRIANKKEINIYCAELQRFLGFPVMAYYLN